MANETNTKVRRVRCPRCRQILQELPEIPVYKCGGCGTVLQAKKRQNQNSGPRSCTRESAPPSLGKDISSSHEESAVSPPLLQDESNTRNRDEFVECIKNVNSSREIFSTNLARESTSLESAGPVHHQETSLGFDHVISRLTLQNLVDDNRSREDISKSPTTRSYYAYDGSTSSCDGDDQFPQQYGEEFGVTGFNSPNEFQSDYVCRANNIPRRKSKMQNKHQAMDFSPSFMRCSHAMNEHGSPSAYSKNIVHHQSDYNNLSSMIVDPEPDRMELLRMVYELEDQLHKTHLGNGKANDMFHTRGTRDDNDDVNCYSRCPVRHGLGKGFPRQFQRSRVPFSGEAAHYRHQTNCLCLHCSPQVRHSSAQLHRGCIYCNNDQTAACSDHNYCSSTSPLHYTSSEYSLSGSSDQRRMDQEKYAKRRHVLPVAGAAPIMVCHYCSELLQMPADFALFKRRCHQVRCNACMKILKFSVRDRIHVIPCLTETLTPPPSKVDDISNSIKGRNKAHAEPMEDGKMKSSKPWNSDETLESAGPSFDESEWGKSSSESVEALPRSGSPLHRLMGYSSVSQVLNAKCQE